jgi:hypothetical protein
MPLTDTDGALWNLASAAQQDPTLEQRNRLMSANDRLERGSNRIRHALEITAETENTGPRK